MAPLGFFLDPSDYFDRRNLRDVVRITHKNEEAYAAALAVVASVAIALQPDGRSVLDVLPDSRTKDAIATFDETWSVEAAAKVLGTSGFAAESVPLALFAAERAMQEGFQPVLRQLVLAGGDVDTIASIYGQVFGASSGVRGLPVELLRDLPGADTLRETAEQLSRV